MTTLESPPFVQLHRITTRDGVRLDGSLACPARNGGQRDRSWSVGLILLVHGTGSHFYDAGLLEQIALRAVADGVAVLRINTRAHDLLANLSTEHGRRLGGAAFEQVEQCPADISGWLDWARQQGYASVGLCGHSIGAAKSIYSQAQDPHPAVRRIVALVPPRFHHETWMTDPRSEAFRAHFEQASKLVAAGQGESLMAIRQPLPIYITAEGFLSKYGPEDRFDFVPLLPRVSVPTRIVIGSGSMQASPAFSSTPGAIAALTDCPPHVECVVVDGPDTHFRGYYENGYALVREWFSGEIPR